MSEVSPEPDYIVVARAGLPRVSWLLKALPFARERDRAWRWVEDRLSEQLVKYPELVRVGGPVRSAHPVSWWRQELVVEQWVCGPYVAELAEGFPGRRRRG